MAPGSHSPSANPCLFIMGCPRSGTTLLARMLGAHPEVAVVNETHWLGRWYEKRKGLSEDGLVTTALFDELVEQRKFSQHFRLDRQSLGRLAGEAPVSYAALMSRLFDSYGAARGKRLVGDKDPGYVKHVETLHGLWPQARFVHLIRDGRDVALSATGWEKAPRLIWRFPTWRDDPIATAGLWWEYHVRLGREAGSLLDPSLYYELRYEAFVAEPERALRDLSGFLDVAYDESMLRFNEGKLSDDPGLDAKHAWLSPTEGLRDWRTQMAQDALERFEAAAGELLDELAYERGAEPPSPDAIEHADRLRRAFGTRRQSRVFRLPKRWGPE